MGVDCRFMLSMTITIIVEQESRKSTFDEVFVQGHSTKCLWIVIVYETFVYELE